MEAGPQRARSTSAGSVRKPQRLKDIQSSDEPRISLGNAEVDRILGGGNEWMTEPLEPGKPFSFRTEIAVPVKNAAKMVWSLDFDARELVTDDKAE